MVLDVNEQEEVENNTKGYWIKNLLAALLERKKDTALFVNEKWEKIDVYKTKFWHLVHPDSNLPFRIGSNAFKLPENVEEQLDQMWQNIVNFYHTADNIYHKLPENHKWKKILSNNRPQWMLDLEKNSDTTHLFVRPDFILTKDWVTTTEVETSPFGLALSLFLNESYEKNRIKTKSSNEDFYTYFIEEIFWDKKDENICFILTDHTSQYMWQFEYLCKKLAEKWIDAKVTMSDIVETNNGKCYLEGEEIKNVYRWFYLHESVQDKNLKNILQSGTSIYPWYKSHMEGKALMWLLFEDEFAWEFKASLWEKEYNNLKTTFPKTYVLNDSPPKNLWIKSWNEFAEIPKSKRNYILKISWFSDAGSWAKWVTFLNKLSKENCKKVIEEALESDDIFVIQEFHRGEKFDQDYYDFDEERMKTMTWRVRFTPYFSTKDGKLLTAKTTMCENTDFIHASTSSINTPISWK